MKLPTKIQINEVGPRDGLQNERVILTTDQKLSMIQQLTDAGATYVEVASFVHPKWMPPLADGMDVLKRLDRQPGVTYAALVPNMKGLERAMEVDVDEVSVFFSASEAHNQANLNRSIQETLPIVKEVVEEATRAGKTVRGYLSTVISCPYAGYIEPAITKNIRNFYWNVVFERCHSVRRLASQHRIK
ncbi:hydroxymethylglutaryl-CoA lyase [Kurthia senegalensis]|uniref:hydroxymethylglutaryl-CoA lyase n=1 Tax=Kurthia senegalensis TaxID=1033740 RepID=UPI0002882A89|nr:hydroxymethylglutaryl-CoA lyase [Kurthia senegalensis]